jgi:hypothetical protein
VSEWKPGDVATWPGMGPVLCVPFEPTDLRGATKWANRWGGYTFYDGPTIRRLVVIDPEDEEQVDRLLTLWANQEAPAYGRRSLVAALREYANPTPRIEEPQGLGAVVVDYDGNPWVKVDTAMACDSWTQADAAGSDTWVKFAKLHATRVLSDGVTP